MRHFGRATAAAVLAVLGAVVVLAPAASAVPGGYPWMAVPAANVAASDTSLADTSCTAGGYCMAVGYYDSGPADQAYSEQWTGAAWTGIFTWSTSPKQNNDLYGVSCVSSSFCVAVGAKATGIVDQTLIEQWNGSGWSLLTSPDTDPDQANQLLAVSCTSVTSCVAVGSAVSVAGSTDTLVESWNGISWSVVDSPDAGTGGLSELNGVSCLAPTSCTAVGDYFTGSVSQTLVESWNGATWSIVPSPDVAAGVTSVLTSDSCSSPTACTAVGYSAAGSSYQTLVEEWNGTFWYLMASPDTAPSDFDLLQSVSCGSPTSCVAVGSSSPDGSTFSNLIEQWNGGTWTITPGPADPVDGGELFGVSCPAAWSCMAVGDSPDDAPLVAQTMSVRPGYWMVASDGGIFSFGSSSFYGSEGGQRLTSPIVGVAATADRQGYWMVAGDGGVFAFGDAGFYGSEGGQPLTSPIVGIASTPDGKGYWMVASDGGIFTFGDAAYYGSMGGKVLNSPVVGMASTADGQGYWLVAADGGIFAFGDAGYWGSMGGQHLNEPIVGITPTADGQGYWLVASDGGIFSYGDAGYWGSMGGQPLNEPIVGITSTADGRGYWMVSSDGGIFSYGDATFQGSMGGTPLNRPIVGMG